MVFLLSLDFILDSKIELIVENTKNIIEYERNVPFIEMILCYLRENTITEKENLKEVLEELLYRKAEKYLNQLIKVKNESLQISLAEKDLILILQSCCSINPIYAKLSQLALKEYINEFPHLIMRSLVLKSICEIIGINR